MKKLGIWSLVLLALLTGILPLPARAEQWAEVRIPVRVYAQGTEPETGTLYTVELEAVTPGAPMPEGSSGQVYRMELKNGETGYLFLSGKEPGMYDYTIRQVPGTDLGCTYDPVCYRLRLYVTRGEAGGTETTAVIFDQEGGKLPEAVFRNCWAEPATVSLHAWKTMDGETPKDGAFTFRLVSEDGEVVHEVKNDGRRVRFPSLRFDREGTFRFFLKEVAGTDKKILYDRTVYTAVVTVTRDGELHASVAWERNGKPWSGVPTFANYTDTGSPKTGDTIGIWFTVLGLSASALAVLLLAGKKR